MLIEENINTAAIPRLEGRNLANNGVGSSCTSSVQQRLQQLGVGGPPSVATSSTHLISARSRYSSGSTQEKANMTYEQSLRSNLPGEENNIRGEPSAFYTHDMAR